jgi:hypothetical protein
VTSEHYQETREKDFLHLNRCAWFLLGIWKTVCMETTLTQLIN